MKAHKFHTGDFVRFSPGPFDHGPSGDYRIVRPLPADNVENQYRVKNARDGHERVVRESQLQKQ